MARRPRLALAGVPQHVLQPGNNRGPCFFEVSDYTLYLDCLQPAAHQHYCAVYAYLRQTKEGHHGGDGA